MLGGWGKGGRKSPWGWWGWTVGPGRTGWHFTRRSSLRRSYVKLWVCALVHRASASSLSPFSLGPYTRVGTLSHVQIFFTHCTEAIKRVTRSFSVLPPPAGNLARLQSQFAALKSLCQRQIESNIDFMGGAEKWKHFTAVSWEAATHTRRSLTSCNSFLVPPYDCRLSCRRVVLDGRHRQVVKSLGMLSSPFMLFTAARPYSGLHFCLYWRGNGCPPK